MKQALLIGCITFSGWAAAIESVQLFDTIKQGYGEIDLFHAKVKKRSLNAADIEAFRLSNQGHLVFAVDVNEAASGSEKAQSQGVTVKHAYVTVEINGVRRIYNNFITPTATMVAELEQTERKQYYTFIGETGSARITPNAQSELNGSSFDSTLAFEVADDLTQATSAVLTVELLQTNDSLGDPEAFYDFSAGFEDVALITAEDRLMLETLAPGVQEAPLVIAQSQITQAVDAWVYYPSNDSYFVVSYEDKYPERGDYDFNDLVIGYRVGFGITNNQVSSVIATGYMIARGAAYSHDWYLHLPFATAIKGNATLNLFAPESQQQIPGYPQVSEINNTVDLKVFKDTKSLMKIDGYEFANTLADVPAIKGHKFSVAINLTNPVAMSAIPQPPYDPYLYTEVTNYEIHLPGNASRLAFSTNSSGSDSQFKDAQGYPYALVFPDDWLPPIEQVDLGEAYIKFLDYSQTAGSQNVAWYLEPETKKTKNIGHQFWKW